MSLNDQVVLLNRCIKEKLDLSIELKQLGLVYDSLRYKSNPQIEPPTGIYEKIENLRKPYHAVYTLLAFKLADEIYQQFYYNNNEQL